MKHTTFRVLSISLAVFMLLSLFACSKKEPQTDTLDFVEQTKDPVVETETEEPVPTLPEYMNPLTGLATTPELAGKRPIGVMFNNLREALPQIGLSNCDIIYEVLAEGGITRFEGLIHDYASAANLGSIRSSRPYYVNIARAHDAIYIHAGGSEAAYSLMSSTGIDHFDGVRGNFYVGDKLLFWRDQGRLNSGYAMEHTMFSNGADVAAAVAQRNLRTQLNDPAFTAFHFDPAFAGIGSGLAANYIKIPHSTYSVSEFNYDSATGLYLHDQYGNDHIDGANNKQIATENVFIIFADERYADSYGRLAITLTGEGSGFYFNGGEYTQLVWKRADDSAPFQYYKADGTELPVKQGKSYVVIVDTDTQNSVVIS